MEKEIARHYAGLPDDTADGRIEIAWKKKECLYWVPCYLDLADLAGGSADA